MVSNGNWTEWSTIQESVDRVAQGRFEITNTTTPELNDTKCSYYNKMRD